MDISSNTKHLFVFDPDATQPIIPITDEMLAQLEPSVPSQPAAMIFCDMPVNRLEDLHDSASTFLRKARQRHLRRESWFTGLTHLVQLLEHDLRRHYPNG